MNESFKKENVAEAIFGVFFIFLILGIFLYKFGTNKDAVTNPEREVDSQAKTALEDQFNNPENENDLYKKYVKEIYDIKSQGNENIETQNKIEQIVSSYQKDLENQTFLPPQNVFLRNVSTNFTDKNYADNFEIIFNNFKTRGGTSESSILSAQISPDGNLLVLSQDDKETISRLADEYESFSEKVQNLSTPTNREKIGKEIAISALNVAYILRKLATEEDKNIYTLWISKYAENMSVIITDRYALYTK